MARNAATIRIKPIVPKRKFRPNIFYTEFRNALIQTRDEMYEDFALTTWSWNHVVTFTVTTRTSGLKTGQGMARVTTRDRIWALLNAGARGHYISRRRAPALRFQANFRPKTSVRFIGSRPGGKYGPWRTAQRVPHPGHESRLFVETIARKNQPRLVRKAYWAMAEGVRKSGYAI